jgi:lipopolysaccharide export system protein LptA
LGHVVILNDTDQSRATGDQADYARTNDLFQLTGSPTWSNAQMEIKGRTLTSDTTSKTYHARGDSNLKVKVTGARSNQWLCIDSEDMDYQTNLAVFVRNVKSRLFEDGALRDTLTCDKLDVELFTNEVKTAIARGHVQGETAADKQGRIQTIACDKLTAHRSLATKLMTDIVAEDHVILCQFGTNAERARLTSARATAYFSPVTNRLERAVAERDVVIDYVKTNQSIHATGEHAVFTVMADEVKLTGTPAARMDRYSISDCDCMIWQPKTNSFRAFGPYTIVPAETPSTNRHPKP